MARNHMPTRTDARRNQTRVSAKRGGNMANNADNQTTGEQRDREKKHTDGEQSANQHTLISSWRTAQTASSTTESRGRSWPTPIALVAIRQMRVKQKRDATTNTCLLYTSDAADDM
eukprot:1032626-Lingulodinium_polyedra.AAC.1